MKYSKYNKKKPVNSKSVFTSKINIVGKAGLTLDIKKLPIKNAFRRERSYIKIKYKSRRNFKLDKKGLEKNKRYRNSKHTVLSVFSNIN